MEKLWSDCVAIAEEAFSIGKQADPLDVGLVAERLERVKELAET